MIVRQRRNHSAFCHLMYAFWHDRKNKEDYNKSNMGICGQWAEINRKA